MLKKLKSLVIEEEGQALTEYGLIIGLIALVVVGTLAAVGDQLFAKFNEIVTKLGGTAVTK